MRIRKMLSAIIAMTIVGTSLVGNVSADSKCLNVKTFMNSNEYTVYGMPSAYSNRFTYLSSSVKGYYSAVASINMNMYSGLSNEYIKQTLLEQCSNYEPDNMKESCTHWSDSLCTNGTTSSPSSIHHTNFYNVMNQLPGPASNYVVMLLTPNILCYQKTSGHVDVNGKCLKALNCLAACDVDYYVRDLDEDYPDNLSLQNSIYRCRENVVHEIGHLYNITDHYNTVTNTSADNCIWGPNYYKYSVYSTISTCANCADTLKKYASKYNHTPIE